MAERTRSADTRLAEARRRYAVLIEERRQRRRFEPLFHRSAAQGRIGAEQPARWVDAVRSSANGRLEGDPRHGVPHVIEAPETVEVRATDMSFELAMRHEAELPAFLAELARNAPGLFTLSGCRMARRDDGSASKRPPAIIGASCRIRWLTVALSGVEPGWLPEAGPEGDGGDTSPPGAPGPRPDTPMPGPDDFGFGRLFTTVAERTEIESALARRDGPAKNASRPDDARAPPDPAPRPAHWVRVAGVVARSGRSRFAWVDGRRVDQAELHTSRAGAASTPAPRIRFDAAGRSITVRPGERFNPRTGAVIDPIRRPRERIERARFLRESSRAPLTHFSLPGQN